MEHLLPAVAERFLQLLDLQQSHQVLLLVEARLVHQFAVAVVGPVLQHQVVAAIVVELDLQQLVVQLQWVK